MNLANKIKLTIVEIVEMGLISFQLKKIDLSGHKDSLILIQISLKLCMWIRYTPCQTKPNYRINSYFENQVSRHFVIKPHGIHI